MSLSGINISNGRIKNDVKKGNMKKPNGRIFCLPEGFAGFFVCGVTGGFCRIFCLPVQPEDFAGVHEKRSATDGTAAASNIQHKYSDSRSATERCREEGGTMDG